MVNAGNRIIKNTFILYAKSAITMVISLFATRWILLGLGETDFGIYNLVAGVIGMLMFLNTSMAAATQRFLSFYNGKNDLAQLKQVFFYSVVLHFIIGLVIVILFETIGLWCFDNLIKVPAERISAARMLYQVMIFCTFVNIISVPYTGSINSHENMLFLTIINVIASIVRFTLAYLILYVPSDRLIFYGIGMGSIELFILLSQRIYCIRHYQETHIKLQPITNKALLKNITNYAGWNLFGTIFGTCRGSFLMVVLNSFFGVVVNAAYGVATQVYGYMSFLTSSIVTSFRPQIVKSEGAGNHDRMVRLSLLSSKLTTLLLMATSLPIIFNTTWILEIWLKKVPIYADVFTQWYLLSVVVAQMTAGLIMAVESTGKIKLLQIVVGSMHVMPLLMCIVMFYFFNLQPYTAMYILVIEESINALLRIFIASKVAGVSKWQCFKEIIIPLSFLILLNYAIFYGLIDNIVVNGFFKLIISSVLCLALIISFSYTFVFNSQERIMVGERIKNLAVKIHLVK